MGSIYLSFSLKPFSCNQDDTELLEKDYQTIYKPIAKFLYNNPQVNFSFSCTGIQINYFKQRRKELLTILKEMVERRQIELIGGSYYNAVLPLIFPVDRNSQIDLLSAELRQITSKRPRGVTLFADCWDPSLVGSLQNCGIEYALLDSSLIPQDKLKFLPIIMSDFGKSIEIMPCYNSFIPVTDQSPKDFISQIIKSVQKIEKKDKYVQISPERIINLNISHSQMFELIQTKWFEQFALYLKENPDCIIKTITPSAYNKNNVVKIPGFISVGINSTKITDGQLSVFQDQGVNLKQASVFDYLYYYNKNHSLYNRIMYMSMLVNQYKADKMRKKAAREKLWQGQNGVGLLKDDSFIFSKVYDRQKCFNLLMDVENILREGSDFKETIACFDYNGDGLNEYVCRMNQYFATVSLISGAIQDLQPLRQSGNYADNLSRLSGCDGQTDFYYRGLFVDFLFSQDQYEQYIQGDNCSDGVFSQIHYKELKFSPNRHEICLCANAIFGSGKQEVSLIKKYIINSQGMNVQYILKNNSQKVLKAKFTVESNFNDINFINSKYSSFTVEVLNIHEKQLLDSNSSTVKLNKKNKLNNIDIVRISDPQNEVSFAFEPNELCSYYYAPITFIRPDMNDTLMVSAITGVSSLIWDINVEPGKETEKNINFTISWSKKIKKEK